jgi:thiosulfate/3-mercaptopyruvate sulfurtransferase
MNTQPLPSPLISTQELAAILGQPGLRIADCRFDLARPDFGHQSYLEAHIPGAFYADLNRDLAAVPSSNTGRHPLPDPTQFSNLLASWGIQPGVKVVVYDAVGGSFASRLWWMLHAMGHVDVVVLDGGYGKWLKETRPLTQGNETIKPTQYHYSAQFNPSMYVTTSQVEKTRATGISVLIDARARERYLGLTEPIDPVAGHIPGALNRFHAENLTPEGTFKPALQLKQEFSTLLGDTPSNQAIVYCGSGVTSCFHLVAMALAGLDPARLYIGSWSEWIRDPEHPVAKQ